MVKKRSKFTVWRLLALGYLAVIAVGSVLLILPFASTGGTGYIDALFTAASATCVTGLVAYDTATHWTVFGQIVILLLIQLGGLGFMTIVGVIVKTAGQTLSLKNRNAVMLSAGARKMSGVSTLVKRILIGTAVCEFAGAAILCIRFVPDFGARGIWLAVWHSVSAFCNAGFDLMGSGGAQFVSLTRYATDPLVSLVIPLLIIIGGLGFCVWDDMWDCRFNFKKYKLYTKVVLVANLALIFISTWLFLWFEYDNPSYEGYDFAQKLLASFFNAVTPRTAGFSTTPPETLSHSGVFLTTILMMIGGSSGSTAGGIKVSTFTVIIMGMLAVFRGHKDINIGSRRIEYSLLSQALAIFTAFLMLVMLSSMIICAIEPPTVEINGNEINMFRAVLFETFSALGTVGLSLGITPTLCVGSKIILIILMYAGRAGILTLALALGENSKPGSMRKPLDTLLIG